MKNRINKKKLLKSLDVVDRFKGVETVVDGNAVIQPKYIADYLVLEEFLYLIKRKKIKLEIKELGEDEDFEYIRKLLG